MILEDMAFLVEAKTGCGWNAPQHAIAHGESLYVEELTDGADRAAGQKNVDRSSFVTTGTVGIESPD